MENHPSINCRRFCTVSYTISVARNWFYEESIRTRWKIFTSTSSMKLTSLMTRLKHDRATVLSIFLKRKIHRSRYIFLSSFFFFERLKVEAAPSFTRRSNDHPNGRPSFLIRLSRKERCCVLLVGKVTGERVRRKIDTPHLFVIVSASVGEQMEVLLARRRKKQETKRRCRESIPIGRLFPARRDLTLN